MKLLIKVMIFIKKILQDLSLKLNLLKTRDFILTN